MSSIINRLCLANIRCIWKPSFTGRRRKGSYHLKLVAIYYRPQRNRNRVPKAALADQLHQLAALRLHTYGPKLMMRFLRQVQQYHLKFLLAQQARSHTALNARTATSLLTTRSMAAVHAGDITIR